MSYSKMRRNRMQPSTNQETDYSWVVIVALLLSFVLSIK